MTISRPRPTLLGPTTAVALVVVCLASLGYSRERFLDADELVHLNAAHFVARGETLYGTVFENHPPLTALLLQPIVRSSDDPAVLIDRARWLIFALKLAILALTSWMGARIAGRDGAALAPFLLLCHVFFFQKTVEVRPDVPATLLLLLSVASLARGVDRGAGGWLAAGGGLLAGAGLFTPKIVYAGFGAVLGAALAARAARCEPASRSPLRTLAPIALGAAAVLGLAAAELARQGLLAGFARDVVGGSLAMTLGDTAPLRRWLLAKLFVWSPATTGLGLAGIAGCWIHRRSLPQPLLAVAGGSLLAGLLGVLHVSAPLRQYCLCFLPQLAVAGAWLAAALWRRAVAALPRGALLPAACLGLAAVAAVPARTIHTRYASHAWQLRVIEAVTSRTGPDDRVFDCWTGLFLTRLPAYRYFFLNYDVLSLLSPDQVTRDLPRALRDPRVRVALVDEICASLPDPVKRVWEHEFRPVPGLELVRVRRGPAGRGPERPAGAPEPGATSPSS